MNMIQTYIQTWKNSFNYSDRSSRREFWIFGLLNIVISVILCVPLVLSVDTVTGEMNPSGFLPYLVFFVASILPSIALYARRFHDFGKSGFLQLLMMVPLVGLIVFFVLGIIKGDESDNTYGSAPAY